ncbi:hypothetical protein HELRODRAFT_160200 [Helobdella robusta]|uniref:Uncharacterized protein n=1 Tax=Helobdella robusta TaxID=6412 RepID=T1EPY7_HELRO|nr:hypothetical protein HELRODRAFT_160200 [Helobdella robusta]ESO06070.1 hypothetical protein HELRODRAFT_160200 [Helobdella robusta]
MEKWSMTITFWDVYRKLRKLKTCRNDLYNNFVEITKKSSQDLQAQKDLSKINKSALPPSSVRLLDVVPQIRHQKKRTDVLCFYDCTDILRGHRTNLEHEDEKTLEEIFYNMFSRKAPADVIKPETLPPTEGAAAQHSLRAYLQTRDGTLLQIMSLKPIDYEWA